MIRTFFAVLRSKSFRSGDSKAPLTASSRRCAHQGHAGVPHHLGHVLEVHVDVAGLGDDLDDAPDGGRQDLVGHREGLVGEGVAEELVQFLIVDDEEAVHVLLQLVDAVHGLGLGFVALVLERDGDDGDGEDAAVLRHLGDDRRGARARTAAHAGGDEEHLGTVVQHLGGNLVLGFQGGVAAFDRVRARAEALGAHLDLRGHFALEEGLGVGVADDEVAALDLLLVHVIHGVAATAAYADDLDDGVLLAPVTGHDVVVQCQFHSLFLLVFLDFATLQGLFLFFAGHLVIEVQHAGLDLRA